jgi:predicted GNAT family N-acyltransferase
MTDPSPGGDAIRTWTMTSLEDLPLIYAIRREVFVDEQHLTNTVRDDPDDRYSLHVLASVETQVVAVGRVTFIGDEAQIAWVAVRRPYRGRGVGWAVMERLLELSR